MALKWLRRVALPALVLVVSGTAALAESVSGDASEVDAQHQMLKYECGADGAAVSMATLKMVRK